MGGQSVPSWLQPLPTASWAFGEADDAIAAASRALEEAIAHHDHELDVATAGWDGVSAWVFRTLHRRRLASLADEARRLLEQQRQQLVLAQESIAEENRVRRLRRDAWFEEQFIHARRGGGS